MASEPHPVRIALPGPAKSRAGQLYLAHLRAKAALALYVEGLLAGLGLDPADNWNLDTESMTLTRESSEPKPEPKEEMVLQCSE